MLGEPTPAEADPKGDHYCFERGALSIKTEHQSWSVRQVIAGAVASGHLPDGVRPAHSTVHRLLRAEGLMSKPTAAGDGTDRRRFSYRFAGQLWMSDVMHGPSVTDGNRRRKSYLISFLDDATRVSPFSAFAAAENTVAFLPVFKQALIRRGVPPGAARQHPARPVGAERRRGPLPRCLRRSR